jgi:hypothetical protein
MRHLVGGKISNKNAALTFPAVDREVKVAHDCGEVEVGHFLHEERKQFDDNRVLQVQKLQILRCSADIVRIHPKITGLYLS